MEDYLRKVSLFKHVSHSGGCAEPYTSTPLHLTIVHATLNNTHTTHTTHNTTSTQQIPAAKLAVLGEMCNYEFVKAGQRVCTEGEAGSEIYIVLDGHLAVSTTAAGGGKEGGGGPVRLATLGPGEYFGELVGVSLRSGA
jgi:hypothetical protein